MDRSTGLHIAGNGSSPVGALNPSCSPKCHNYMDLASKKNGLLGRISTFLERNVPPEDSLDGDFNIPVLDPAKPTQSFMGSDFSLNPEPFRYE